MGMALEVLLAPRDYDLIFSCLHWAVAKGKSIKKKSPSTLRTRNLKTEVSLWKEQKFSIHTTPEELRFVAITGHLDLCLRETREKKSRDYRDVIIAEKFPFLRVFRSHWNAKQKISNSSGLKSEFEKLRFRDG